MFLHGAFLRRPCCCHISAIKNHARTYSAFTNAPEARKLAFSGYGLNGAAYWLSLASFIVFALALNAGPHLVNFIPPSRIYSIAKRGAGMGLSTLLGKPGANTGIFATPPLLRLGGVQLALAVCILAQSPGALATFVYGKRLKLL